MSQNGDMSSVGHSSFAATVEEDRSECNDSEA